MNHHCKICLIKLIHRCLYILLWTVVYDDNFVFEWNKNQMLLSAVLSYYVCISLFVSWIILQLLLLLKWFSLPTWINRLNRVAQKKLKLNENAWHFCSVAIRVCLSILKKMMFSKFYSKKATSLLPCLTISLKKVINGHQWRCTFHCAWGYLTQRGQNILQMRLLKSSIIQSLQGIEPLSSLTSRRPRL